MYSYEEMVEQLNEFPNGILKSQARQLKIDQFKRLIQMMITDKALGDKIRNEDEQTATLIEKSFYLLSICIEQELVNNLARKEYILSQRELQKRITMVYNLKPKGTYVGMYMAVGIAFGAGTGAIFISKNPSYYSVCIGVGLVLGITIGNMKENEEIKAGKIY